LEEERKGCHIWFWQLRSRGEIEARLKKQMHNSFTVPFLGRNRTLWKHPGRYRGNSKHWLATHFLESGHLRKWFTCL
jgi:hypothetical protein